MPKQDTDKARRILSRQTSRHQTLRSVETSVEDGPPRSMYVAIGALVLFVCGLLAGTVFLLAGGSPERSEEQSVPPLLDVAATLIQPEPTPVPIPDYPYITNVTENARRIFVTGQANGNRPDVFSKVGDSITVAPQFLTPIGTGTYLLRDHTYLQPIISYYSRTTARDANSFANTSLAAAGGWSAFTVVNPGARDRELCGETETPLACEYRLVRPSVALVMLGTNDVLTTPLEQYEGYMRDVVTVSIEMGVIPVLSTVPEMQWEGVEGRVDAINAIVRGLATEYDVPLWDYHAALAGVANEGISDDGVHPSGSWTPVGSDLSSANLSQYGMSVRNLTALHALDVVWRAVILPETGENIVEGG